MRGKKKKQERFEKKEAVSRIQKRRTTKRDGS